MIFIENTKTFSDTMSTSPLHEGATYSFWLVVLEQIITLATTNQSMTEWTEIQMRGM